MLALLLLEKSLFPSLLQRQAFLKGLHPQNRTLYPNLQNSLSSSWLSSRPISRYQLYALLHLHLTPIYPVLSGGTSGISTSDTSS